MASADTRARVQRLRARLIRWLPDSLADGLRRAVGPFRSAAVEPNRLANLEAAMAGAAATDEASVVGLSQELARVEARVDELTARVDDLTAEVHQLRAVQP